MDDIAVRLRRQSDEYWAEGSDLVRAAEDDDATSDETRKTWRRAGENMLTMAGLLDDAATTIRALRELVTSPGDWKPINTAPRDGSEVLLYSPHLDDVWVGAWTTGRDNIRNCDWADFVTVSLERGLNPTRWMPLPAPPQASPLQQEKTDG